MELQLATTQEMSEAIESIDGFTEYLTSQCEENPDKVFIFTNKLRKAIDEVEKHAKTRGNTASRDLLRAIRRIFTQIDSESLV
jgi:hypothetical protein